MQDPTRRALLAGGAALSLTLLAPRSAASAATFNAESFGVASLSDGHLAFPPGFYLPEAPVAEIEALLRGAGHPTDTIRPDCNVALYRGEGRLVLFDTGAGSRFVDTAGELPDALAAAGVAPEEVTDVVFTHAHPDHLWGVLDDFDEPLYANAAHHISKSEWDFWIDEGTVDVLPDAQKPFASGAKRNLEAIEDKVVRFDFETEILPNVFALDTRGHTPGHSSFEIRHGGERFLVVGDAITHPLIAFRRPDWVLGTDQDPERAIATRRMLLDRLAAERLAAIGFHWTAPGIGFVERADGAFRFAAV